jgi:gamma-glutamyltranspeptidase
VSFDKGLQELLAPNGTLLKQGDVMKRPLLGHTLQLIAEKGPDEFYFGSLMKDSVAFLQELGGIVTEEDFEMYQVVERKPLIGWFHGQKVITAPPPARFDYSLFTK